MGGECDEPSSLATDPNHFSVTLISDPIAQTDLGMNNTANGHRTLGKMRYSTLGTEGYRLRAYVWRRLSEVLDGHQGPVLVVGDLNMTARSSLFQWFLHETGLRDSRRGFTLQPTYPVGILSLFMVPIDHILVSNAVLVLNRALGPDIGSYNRPVELENSLDC